MLEERESGITKRQNVWSPFYVDELILRDRDNDNTLDGTLDIGFAGDGKDYTDGGPTIAHAVVIQPDGKTVSVGQDSNGDFALVRHMLDGVEDSTFGTGGIASLDFGSSLLDIAYGVAIQADGKILAAGAVDSNSKFGIARFDSNGSPDTDFSTDGMASTAVFGVSTEVARGLAIQADGKIIVTGHAKDSGNVQQAAVVRYNADGTIDTSSFGGDGIATTSLTWNFTAYGVALQEDGKILVGGRVASSFVVIRFNSDGTLDTGYGSSGVATVSFSGYSAGGNGGLALQADGKLVISAALIASGGTEQDLGLARLNTNGTLDTDSDSDTAVHFSTDGKHMASTASTLEQAYGLRIAADGKVVVAGRLGNNFAVWRFNTDGSADTTFNNTGVVSTDVLGVSAINIARAFAIGPDYKITAVGQTGTGSLWAFGIARYKVSSGLEERLYAQTDANHNVTSVADVFGAVKERFVYDPYGSATVLNPDWTTDAEGSDYAWVQLHQGLRYDGDTGLYDNRMRAYSPVQGRFISADPLGYPDGLNRYEYVRDKPVSHVDPEGLQSGGAAPRPTTRPTTRPVFDPRQSERVYKYPIMLPPASADRPKRPNEKPGVFKSKTCPLIKVHGIIGPFGGFGM